MSFDWAAFRQLLVTYLNDRDLKTVCFDINLDWGRVNIYDEDTPGRVREFIILIKREHMNYPLSKVLIAIHRLHPSIDFAQFGGPSSQKNKSIPIVTEPQPTISSQSAQSHGRLVMAYENFDIVLREEMDGTYTISASYSFRGGAQSKPYNFEFDPNTNELANLYTYLKEHVADKEDIIKLGSKIYDLLFPPEVNQLFVTLRERVREDSRGVRIRVDIRSAVNKQDKFSPLIHMPWEYCYNSKFNTFLGKEIRTPIVRYISQDYTPDPLITISKLRILLILSNPTDVPPLDVAGEESIMREALKDQGSLGIQGVTGK